MHIPTPAELQKAKKPESHASTEDLAEVRRESAKDVLPIDAKRAEIVEAVNDHQAVVLGAETGAGKSTRVSRILMDEGYDVIITEPRRMAARTVSERVAKELEQDGLSPDLVGYRTGRDRNDSSAAKMLYCTDGLQLIRELHEKRVPGQKRALVIDEVHEWNTNIELLVAWAKKQMQEDPNFKVVCMSATFAGKPLQEYFGANAALIEVEGRTYPVEKHVGTSVVADTVRLSKEGKSVLVFLPGKNEIDSVKKDLLQHNLLAEIVCLDGSMDTAEQKKAIASYPNGKIVLSTNVAQTGVTIPDIDAVVDSGKERRKEVRNGIEGLYLADISQADCLQRAGRAGRVKPGEYYLSTLNGESIVPLEQRQEFATPEILRSRLDTVIMKLAGVGFDIDEFDFYHQPKKQEVAMAKDRLVKLGALTPDGGLTNIGRLMEKLPVDSHYARMLVEIQKHNNPQLTFMMMELIAIQQAGGIVKNGKNNLRWKKLTAQNQSDLLAELEVFHAIEDMPKAQWKDYDVLSKNVFEAHHVLRDLKRALRISFEAAGLPKGEDVEKIQKAIIAGLIDQVWVRGAYYGSSYTSAFTGESRELSNSSLVAGSQFIVAQPFNLQIQGRRGPITLELLQDVTAIQPEWITEIAPQLISVGEQVRTSFNPISGELVAEGDLKFGSIIVGSKEVLPTESQSVNAYLRCLQNSQHMYSRWYAHLDSELRELSTEIRIHDSEYARELDSRLPNTLRSKIAANMPTSLYNCLSNPPRITIEEVFTNSDVEKIEFLAQKNPAQINIGDICIPVQYERSYYSSERIAGVTLDLSVAARLLDVDDFPDAPDGLNVRLYDAGSFVESFDDFAELRDFVVDYLSAKSEYALERAAEAEEESFDKQAIAKGNPEYFGGKVRLRTGSGNVGYWVIKKDGSLRQPDNDGVWRVLRDDEIAITVSHPARDPMVGVHTIAWQPGIVTSEQLATIRDIESDLSMMPGAWAVTKEEVVAKQSTINALRSEDFIRSLIDEMSDGLSEEQIYNQLWSDTGWCLDIDPRAIYKNLNLSQDNDSEYYADGRPADCLEIVQVTDDLAVSVLGYYKYGRWNLALKLIRQQASKIETDSDEGTADMELALQALKNKFS